MKKERQIKKGFLAVLVLLFSVVAKAQYWVPLNFQPDTKPSVTYANDHYYYVCYEDGYTNKGKLIKIAKWDGLVWQRATPLVLDSNATIYSMCEFKGEIYLGGNFHLPFQVNIQNLLKLTTSKWSTIKGGAVFSKRSDAVYTLTSDESGVYIGGSFDTINKRAYKNLVFYNGERLDELGGFGANGRVSKLEFIGSTLYALGSFSEIGKVNSKGIAYYRGKEWLTLGGSLASPVKEITYFQSAAFVAVPIGNNYYFYRNETGTTDWTKHMNGLFACKAVYDLINYNNEVYACGKFFFSSMDSVNLVTWNGSAWEKVEQNIFSCKEFQLYKKKLHASGDIVKNQNINRPIYTARFEPNMVLVRGQVFWDKDENCKVSGQDRYLARERIKLSPSERYLYTNEKGYFSALIDKTIEYKVELEPRLHWKSSSCSQTVFKFDFSRDGDLLIQFPLVLVENKKDIRVDLSAGSGWAAAKGERQFYKIRYKNLGSVRQDGIISLKFDTRLNDFEAYPAPTIYNPGSVSWRFSNLDINEQNEIGFYVRIDDYDIKDKDNLDFVVSATIPDDENDRDNFDSLKQEVSSNSNAKIYKAIYPEPGYGDSISEMPSTQEFVEFNIHFENENDVPVRTVHVIDTIDLNLSLAHIQELGASHPYTTQVLNDPLNPSKGILIWTFKDIYLEKFDSEGGSENPTFGYISFEMKLKQNAIGTIFSNQARVIYDYTNDEYLTNRVWGKIVDETIGIKDIHYEDSRLTVYPIPAIDQTSISLEDGFNSIHLMNELGQEVLSLDLGQMEFNYDLNTKDLPSGNYFLLVKNNSNVFVKKILKK